MKRDCPAWIVEESTSIQEPLDDLQMNYNGNQLTQVFDNANTDNMKYADNGITLLFPENDFKDGTQQGTDSYLYDKNGNQTADINKKIAWIRYNSLNLPEKIQFMNGNTSEYFYDATGVKRKAVYLTLLTPLEIPLGDVSQEFVPDEFSEFDERRTDYCGNIIYENGTLGKILTPEGYLSYSQYYYKPTPTSTPTFKTEWMHNYFLRDHLGNTRVQLKQNKNIYGNSYFSVADSKDYYAFGLEQGKPWEQLYGGPTSTNPYLYNGKEMDRMHGLNQLDYGARWYDPSLGRWGGVMDPLAEKYYGISPYAYCAGNPIRYIDPTGMAMNDVTSTHTDEDGNVVAVFNDGDFGVYKHDGNAEETKKELKDKYSCKNTSGGGRWLGETAYWDEFVDRNHNGILKRNPDGSYKAYGKIMFDETWDYEIDYYFMYANEFSSLSDLALCSQSNGFYDIKSGYANGTGKKLNGKYATAESAGNYLAGLNAAGRVSFDMYMRLAGALHAGGMKAVFTSLLTGKEYGQYPWYGETNYCTRRVMEGWLSNRKAKDRSTVLQRIRLINITQ